MTNPPPEALVVLATAAEAFTASGGSGSPRSAVPAIRVRPSTTFLRRVTSL